MPGTQQSKDLSTDLDRDGISSVEVNAHVPSGSLETSSPASSDLLLLILDIEGQLGMD